MLEGCIDGTSLGFSPMGSMLGSKSSSSFGAKFGRSLGLTRWVGGESLGYCGRDSVGISLGKDDWNPKGIVDIWSVVEILFIKDSWSVSCVG